MTSSFHAGGCLPFPNNHKHASADVCELGPGQVQAPLLELLMKRFKVEIDFLIWNCFIFTRPGISPAEY